MSTDDIPWESDESETNQFPSLKDVESTSTEFNALATAVAEKLEAFLLWLNTLPGHTEVEVFGPHPNTTDYEFMLGLRIDRAKGGWKLYFVEAHQQNMSMSHGEWLPLEQANLELRCAALSLLPSLVQKMHREQSKLIDRLRVAKGVLDTLPITKRPTGKERV